MKEFNLTSGPILKNLILFSLPMIAGNLLQQVYSLVDTMIVGKFISSQALAAVGSSYTLMVFLTSIIIGLCMGSGALFSEDYGAISAKDCDAHCSEDDGAPISEDCDTHFSEDYGAFNSEDCGSHFSKDYCSTRMQKLKEDTGYSFWFIAFVTLLLYLILYPGKMLILSMLHIPPELMSMTVEYVSVIFVGIVFVFLYNFFAYLLRARGNSVTPLIFLGISSVLNIVLDLVFVLGLHMGVTGAALATVISQAFAGVGISVYAFVRVSGLRASLFMRHWNWLRLRSIVANDIATAIQQSVMNFGILMIQGLVNSFGACVMASFAAAVKIDTIAYMPAQEFGNAYSLFVSQNHGAREQERIRNGTKSAFAVAVAFSLVVSACIWIFAGQLLELFVDASETEIIAEGIRYLHIEGAMYIGIGMLFLWYAYFRGIGKPYISLVLTVVSLGTRVALSYALAPHTALGVVAIWCAIPIGWFLADAAGLAFYSSRRGQSPLG